MPISRRSLDTVTVPSGATVTLQFFVVHTQASGNAVDRLELAIDGLPIVFFPEAAKPGRDLPGV